jgi:DNA polymerase elongation subunit (family B)
MKFYTSVNRYGNNLLVRGYNQSGKRIEKKVWFKPTLWTVTKNQSKYTSLDGVPVRPHQFESMRDAKDFIDRYKDVENHSVFGMRNYIFQYINEVFPGDIKFDAKFININTIDIEVASDDGFPEPEKAEKEIISIAMHSNRDNIWRIFGLGDYDASKSYILKKRPNAIIQYVKCENEIELILKFLGVWSRDDYCPDVVTGWYVRFFDIPYLINRITRVLGEKEAKKLSPWGMINQRFVQFKGGKSSEAFEIVGVQTLDYLDLFTKFGHAYGGNQESNKLDHIAHVVLGENKLSYDEYGSLNNLYKENHQLFIDYNLRDIELVERMEDEMSLIELVFTMAYRGGVNYSDTLGTTAIWDSIINRYLFEQNKIIPHSGNKLKQSYPGGYVKDPTPGRYSWVVSFDLNSLYPNLIAQYNMSPETLRDEPGHPSNMEYYLKTNSKVKSKNCIAANGQAFTKDFKGILPTIVEKYYDERKAIKKTMLKNKQEYEKTKDSRLKIEIQKAKNSEQAIKLLLNSLYGAIGNNHFRYFDIRMAMAVTLSGQLSILWAEKHINQEINRIMKTDNVDYIIAIDTDSVYINFGPLIEKIKPKDPVVFLDKICEDHFKPVIDKAYKHLYEKQNCFVNRMWMAREVIADAGIWTAKKRYILNVHNSEGVQYDEPELKIMGIEAIKSSTPEVCRGKMQDLFKIIIKGNESETQNFIQNFKSEFKQLPAHEIATPKGVSSVQEYEDRQKGYKKGTPIHSRAAIVHNMAIKNMNLENKYELIRSGDKIKYVYMRVPNPVKENVFGFIDFMPKELKLEAYIDYDTQFQKVFLDPMVIILNAIGWSPEEQNDLESFFE